MGTIPERTSSRRQRCRTGTRNSSRSSPRVTERRRAVGLPGRDHKSWPQEQCENRIPSSNRAQTRNKPGDSPPQTVEFRLGGRTRLAITLQRDRRAYGPSGPRGRTKREASLGECSWDDNRCHHCKSPIAVDCFELARPTGRFEMMEMAPHRSRRHGQGRLPFQRRVAISVRGRRQGFQTPDGRAEGLGATLEFRRCR